MAYNAVDLVIRDKANLSNRSQSRRFGLRESDASSGICNFTRGTKEETVKVRGRFSSNDGETGVLWALARFGILMRSEWDIHAHLDSGYLVPVLQDWVLPSADIFAVYPERAHLSAKVSAFIDFLAQWFGRYGGWKALAKSA